MAEEVVKEAEEKKPFEKKSVVDIIVDRVLSLIEEKGKLPWQIPWLTGQMNYMTGKPYRGINTMLLMGGCGEYITMKQLMGYNAKNKTNFRIKESELKKYYYVFFYKPFKKYVSPTQVKNLKAKDPYIRIYTEDETGKRYYMTFTARYYRVWGINQIADEEGNTLPSKVKRTADDVEEREYEVYFYNAEALANEYLQREGIKLTNAHGQRAFYRQVGDLINMPRFETFPHTGEYYKTLFHEMIHSTGVEYRLKRKWLIDYSDSMETRGVEELIAEIGACQLVSDCDFSMDDMHLDTSTAYLLSWSSWIKDNKQGFVTACSQAMKAVDYITQESATDEEDAEAEE